AFENFLWASNAAAGYERCEGTFLRNMWVGKTLPVAEVSCARYAQGDVRGASHSNGIGNLLRGKTQRLGCRGGSCERTLGGVVEAFIAYRRDIRKPGLYLVRYRESGE